MRRDLGTLADRSYDLLVIGAGIHGACVARDAALRGLRVALVERGDFGHATSHNSFKLIHGGLRYLQHLDLRRVRESIEERRFWLQAAPHLIRPLKFVMPTYGHGTRGREALWLALRAHDVLGFDRNRGLSDEERLPPGRLLSTRECLRLIPGVPSAGLTGAAVWYDAQMQDADRVLLDCVHGAAEAGADVANYLRVDALLGGAARIEGARACDLLEGREIEIKATVTINACGPWTGDLLRRAGRARLSPGQPGMTKGMNLVTRKLFDGYAVGVLSGRPSDAAVGRSRRLYFITPWYDRSVIGTAHLPYHGDPDAWRLTTAEVEGFIDEINAACPGLDLTLDDVHYCYGGLTPAEGESGGEVRRQRQSLVIDHRKTDALAGLVTVVGVKYTTARRVAERAVDLVFHQLRRQPPPCIARHGPLRARRSGSPPPQRAATAQAAQEAEAHHLLDRYGPASPDVLAMAGPAGPGNSLQELFRCCCLYGVREEMAVRLKDLLFVRTNLAARGRLPEGALHWCADMMQAELAWSAERKKSEVAEAEALGVARWCPLTRPCLAQRA